MTPRLDSRGRRIVPHHYREPLASWTRYGTGPRDWGVRGACRQHDPELFFVADKPNSGRYSRQQLADIKRAKAICRSCPVIEACLAHALTAHEAGIWGGLTERERDILQRRAGSDD